jgi:anti-sigma-K factor RskA
MSDMTPNKRQELASAVILGHADAGELAEFKRLYAEDQSFRTLVAEMEEFLSPLSTLSDDAEPPVGVLDDIMVQITGAEPAPSAAAPTPAPEAPQRVRRRRSSKARRHPERPWQYATAASLILAVGSLAVHSIPDTETPDPAPVEVATVQEELLTLMTSGEEAPTVVVLLYDKDSNQITGRLTNVQPPADGVWQLWLLREGLDAPQSLGLLTELSEDGVINLSIATELAAGSDTLAISVEPEGGSPEAGPTGPVVFTGAVSPI